MNSKKNPVSKKNKQLTRRIVQSKDMQTNYANMVRVVHSPNEFVLDFGQLLPGELMLPIKSRIIMTPLGAKLLAKALEDNLKKFEEKNGAIKLPKHQTLADQLFKNLNVDENQKSADETEESESNE